MENYIVKVSIAANNEEDYETFKEKVKDLAIRMNIYLFLNNECICTSDFDESFFWLMLSDKAGSLLSPPL